MAEILIGNIKGPQGAKGDKGDKGDTGPQGPAGPQGATGPMPALVNGFTTTEAGIAALDAAAGKTLKDQLDQQNSDIRIYGNSSFGYTPGIGSYLNDDNYRPRWARSGDNVVVYGVFAVGIAPTENKVILTGFPKPYSHTWISVFEMGTMIGREVYLNENGEIMSGSIPQGNYKINFCYRAK